MWEFVTVAAATLATWVYVDARSRGIRSGRTGKLTDMGALGWAGSVALLWMVAFPVYLRHRRFHGTPTGGFGLASRGLSQRSITLLGLAWLAASSALVGLALLASSNLPFGYDSLYCTAVCCRFG